MNNDDKFVSKETMLKLPIDIFNKALELQYRKDGFAYKISDLKVCEHCGRKYNAFCICVQSNFDFQKTIEEVKFVSLMNNTEINDGIVIANEKFEMFGNVRNSGRTIKLIDYYIQQMFEHPNEVIIIKNHFVSNNINAQKQANEDILRMIKSRMRNEHSYNTFNVIEFIDDWTNNIFSIRLNLK